MTLDARAAYVNNSIATASPARLLVMLYERLVLDVQRGLEAQRRGDHQETHKQLTHAQDIIMELQSSLRPEMFKGGHDLSALYGFLHRQLVLANIRKDAGITGECLTLVTELCDTWRQAAVEAATSAPRSA
ncbi:flagellar export chaperone FliS [Marmoricola sp. RAF53]|uniref:flagellar export chaperone FliS n=1 Tax=Marmoricola sp. RAF53 TaxID=3233059 RepID=UPI003F95886B